MHSPGQRVRPCGGQPRSNAGGRLALSARLPVDVPTWLKCFWLSVSGWDAMKTSPRAGLHRVSVPYLRYAELLLGTDHKLGMHRNAGCTSCAAKGASAHCRPWLRHDRAVHCLRSACVLVIGMQCAGYKQEQVLQCGPVKQMRTCELSSQCSCR